VGGARRYGHMDAEERTGSRIQLLIIRGGIIEKDSYNLRQRKIPVKDKLNRDFIFLFVQLFADLAQIVGERSFFGFGTLGGAVVIGLYPVALGLRQDL
jgi:hypothetical protein